MAAGNVIRYGTTVGNCFRQLLSWLDIWSSAEQSFSWLKLFLLSSVFKICKSLWKVLLSMTLTSFVEMSLSLTEVPISFHRETNLEDHIRPEVTFLNSDIYYTANVWIYTSKQDGLFPLKLSRYWHLFFVSNGYFLSVLHYIHIKMQSIKDLTKLSVIDSLRGR